MNSEKFNSAKEENIRIIIIFHFYLFNFLISIKVLIHKKIIVMNNQKRLLQLVYIEK